jgi:hypothetical protein
MLRYWAGSIQGEATSRRLHRMRFGDVRCWHETDMPTAMRDVRSRGQSGKHILAVSFSGFDPTETSSLITCEAGAICSWLAGRKVLGFGDCARLAFKG